MRRSPQNAFAYDVDLHLHNVCDTHFGCDRVRAHRAKANIELPIGITGDSVLAHHGDLTAQRQHGNVTKPELKRVRRCLRVDLAWIKVFTHRLTPVRAVIA